MATLSERLAYVLTFDTSDGVKSLNKFGATADKELSKAEKKLDKLSAGMTKFGAGAVAFAGVAGAGLVKLATGASDARQNFQALEQVVGSVAATDIKEWADGAAQSIGASSSKAVEAATSFAQLGKLTGLEDEGLSAFSTGLVKIAADFAAFKNVSPEQTLQDIRSAFSGSVEVMRKYGIFLDEHSLRAAYFRETGEQVTGTLTAQQRVIATNAELYRQGADMLGQFERESGSLVGQTEILKAELKNLADGIGAGLLPMLTGGVAAVGDFSEKLGNTSPATQALVGKLAGIAVAATGVVGALSFAGGQAIKMRGRFTTLGNDGSRSLNKLGKSARGVGVAMGALAAVAVAGAAFNALTDSAGRTERALQNVQIEAGKAADGVGNDLVGAFSQAAAEQESSFQGMSSLWEWMGKGIKLAGQDATIGIEAIDRAFESMAQESVGHAQTFIDALAVETEALDHNSQQYRDNMGLITRYQSRLDLQIGATRAVTESLDENTAAAGANADGTDGVGDAARDAAPTIEHLDRNVKALTEAYDDNVDALREMRQATRDAANGAWDAVDAEDAYFDSLENIEEVLGDVESGERDVARAYRDGARATDEMVVAQLESEGVLLDTERGQRQWTESMLETARVLGGPLESEITAHVARVNGIPEEKITQIQAALDRGQVDTARRLIESELSKAEANIVVTPAGLQAARARIEAILGRTIQIATSTYVPRAPTGTGGTNRYGATGGLVTQPTQAIIGEAGPELVIPVGAKSLDSAPGASPLSSVLDDIGGGSSGPQVVVQLTGSIYGVPDDEFVARLTDEISRHLAGVR